MILPRDKCEIFLLFRHSSKYLFSGFLGCRPGFLAMACTVDVTYYRKHLHNLEGARQNVHSKGGMGAVHEAYPLTRPSNRRPISFGLEPESGSWQVYFSSFFFCAKCNARHVLTCSRQRFKHCCRTLYVFGTGCVEYTHWILKATISFAEFSVSTQCMFLLVFYRSYVLRHIRLRSFAV